MIWRIQRLADKSQGECKKLAQSENKWWDLYFPGGWLFYLFGDYYSFKYNSYEEVLFVYFAAKRCLESKRGIWSFGGLYLSRVEKISWNEELLMRLPREN